MLQRKEWTHSKCPRCPEEIEKSTHVWTCPSEGAQDIWSEALDELRLWLASQRTHNTVAEVICTRLQQWWTGASLTHFDVHLLGLQKAVEVQDAMGWDAAFEGRWATNWVEIQGRHFKNNQLQRTGLRWLTAVIRKVWLIAWALWEHRNGVQEEVKNAARSVWNKATIRDEYGLGVIGLAGYDTCLFNKLLVDRLKDTLSHQEAWIRRVQAARIRAQDSLPQRQQRALENFRQLLTQLGHAPRQSNETEAE